MQRTVPEVSDAIAMSRRRFFIGDLALPHTQSKACSSIAEAHGLELRALLRSAVGFVFGRALRGLFIRRARVTLFCGLIA
jgi:hypothetical protein